MAAPVGCVLLDVQDRWLTATAASGVGVHPELIGIRRANRSGPATREGTAIVTMEPCVDCALALVRAGIRRVVYAVPNPSGGASDVFAESGVEIVPGICEAQVSMGVLRPWLHYQGTGAPFVTWVYAASPWGRLALLSSAVPEVVIDAARLAAAADVTLSDADEWDLGRVQHAFPDARHVVVQNFPGGLLPSVDRVVQYVTAGSDGPTRVPSGEWMDAVTLVSSEKLHKSVVRSVWDVDRDAIPDTVALSARA
jgi:diaminohydroxyphosphoribosylaminopyrimidine deaminase/5-amino-6-(5-phosphoribosylamino)uracil reductase